MQELPKPLSALAGYRQFIVYKGVPKADRPGKTDKLPVDPSTGRVADAHNPAIWTDAQSAIDTAIAWGEPFGVGFVFTANDPFWFLDIDNCLDQDPPRWSDLANQLMTRLKGAAVEVSQSRRGLHIIGSGAVPEHGCKNQPLGLELYTDGRFVALTGAHATGDAGTDMSAVIPAIVAEYFPPSAVGADTVRPADWTTHAVPEYTGPEDDDTLISKARGTESGGTIFGTRASFDALWTANTAALSRAYPDNYGSRPYDASSADAALASHLAFWTGCNCERIERLMRQSALMRDKWDKHRSYIHRTITSAVSRCSTVYTSGVVQRVDQPQPESNADPGVSDIDEPQLVSGYQFLAVTQQIEHFAGCVYVQEAHRIFTPRGVLLKPEQFKATYGGYVFGLDATNDKTTKNAWEAFTESQAIRYPIAEGMTFRPDVPPGKLLVEEGRKLVNTYTPAIVDRRPGDVTPFIVHLRKMLPDERDAEILLSYMAACVQHIGLKFQWAPLLQGVEGNGKTLFTRCVAHAVGMQYSHFPKAEEVGNKFNSWMLRKLFIGIEDVWFPDHRREIIESLKPLITNDVLPIELKGVDQISARVCANFIMNSNHKDAIRKTRNDRRFCVFFTAQQAAIDLQRDGLDGEYFPNLYAWLRRGGYAHVAEYLATYRIPDEFNPATRCHRAPTTSTTAQAVEHGVGSIEQEIMEAIEEGRPGFAGGWVSSMALDRLLTERRLARAIPPNRRRDMMRDIGYDWHPALRDGRVNNPIAVDGGGKPRLFIRNDHPDRNIQSPAFVSKAYQDAQSTAGQRLSDRVFATN